MGAMLGQYGSNVGGARALPDAGGAGRLQGFGGTPNVITPQGGGGPAAQQGTGSPFGGATASGQASTQFNPGAVQQSSQNAPGALPQGFARAWAPPQQAGGGNPFQSAGQGPQAVTPAGGGFAGPQFGNGGFAYNPNVGKAQFGNVEGGHATFTGQGGFQNVITPQQGAGSPFGGATAQGTGLPPGQGMPGPAQQIGNEGMAPGGSPAQGFQGWRGGYNNQRRAPGFNPGQQQGGFQARPMQRPPFATGGVKSPASGNVGAQTGGAYDRRLGPPQRMQE